MDTIAELIGNYAFPIVMCLLLWKQNENQDLRHQEEVKELTKVVESNTEMLHELKEMLK